MLLILRSLHYFKPKIRVGKNTNNMLFHHEIWCIFDILYLHYVRKLLTFIYHRMNNCSITVSSSIIMTTPVPDPLALEAPSTYIFHQLESSDEFSWNVVSLKSFCLGVGVNSAIKSASICPLIHHLYKIQFLYIFII